MVAEKRIDADDGSAYTWEEFSEFYTGKYKQKEIAAYWEDCEVVKGKKAKAKAKEGAKAKAKAKTKSKAKAKEGAKAKAKAKTKAKAKAEEPKPKAKVKAKAKAKAAKEPKPAGNFKVCVCGGAGGIGQPLSLLMGMDPNVKELCIFDLSVAMVPPEGVAADLSHLERKCKVSGYMMEVGKKTSRFSRGVPYRVRPCACSCRHASKAWHEQG